MYTLAGSWAVTTTPGTHIRVYICMLGLYRWLGHPLLLVYTIYTAQCAYLAYNTTIIMLCQICV